MKTPASFRELERVDPDLAFLVKVAWFDAHADDVLAISRDVDEHRPAVLRDFLRPLDAEFEALWRRLWSENHPTPAIPL